jgi:hypothetical protein
MILGTNQSLKMTQIAYNTSLRLIPKNSVQVLLETVLHTKTKNKYYFIIIENMKIHGK